MADRLEARPGFRDLINRWVELPPLGEWAEKVVVVNSDGSPITAGASANVAKATAAAPVYAEGANVQLSVDLAGNLRTAGGGGGGGLTDAQLRATPVPVSIAAAVDVSDRAARLVGVVYGSQAAQLVQTPTNFNLKTELAVGATLIDPRSIRALTSSDVVDVSDRAGRALGVVASITAAVAVTNAGLTNIDVALSSRLKPADTLTGVTTVTSLTQMNGVAIAMGTGVRTAGTQRVTIATDDVVPVTGTFWQATQPVSIAAAVDVSDRAARLVGVVYGSQAQQLKQTAVNFNQQVEVFVGASAVDPRSIRALTTADAVNVGQWIGSAAPTVGQKTMANSLPFTLASDQTVLPAVSEIRAATTHVTATAAVNTASTATLAAAGAGLFHYITSVQLHKLYSVVGIANGAGVIVTSTNLPGNPAWTTEQLALAAGSVSKVIDYQPTTPLKSSVANTATTFVAPLQLQTIWRWNISYFTAV